MSKSETLQILDLQDKCITLEEEKGEAISLLYEAFEVLNKYNEKEVSEKIKKYIKENGGAYDI